MYIHIRFQEEKSYRKETKVHIESESNFVRRLRRGPSSGTSSGPCNGVDGLRLFDLFYALDPRDKTQRSGELSLY